MRATKLLTHTHAHGINIVSHVFLPVFWLRHAAPRFKISMSTPASEPIQKMGGSSKGASTPGEFSRIPG